MPLRRFALCLLIAGCIACSPGAQASSAQDVLNRFIDGVQTFEAHFDQTRTDEHGAGGERSSGEFWLARPAKGEAAGKFRWAYEKPYEQLSVCDGSELWTYDPDLNQVTERPARAALAGTPAALLSQRASLESAFSIEDAGFESGARLVRLVPKTQDGDFQSIELALGADGVPQLMRFHDAIGGISEIRFSSVKANGKIDPSRFQFTPPAGADIVKADAPPQPRTAP